LIPIRFEYSDREQIYVFSQLVNIGISPKKARLNLINRAGPSPREDGSRWCQAQENKVAPARSARIRFKKKACAHVSEQSLRSNTCRLILRLIFELGNLYYFGAAGKPLRNS